jgi:hypothetical protein
MEVSGQLHALHALTPVFTGLGGGSGLRNKSGCRGRKKSHPCWDPNSGRLPNHLTESSFGWYWNSINTDEMHHHSINAERFEISEVIPQADVLLGPTWGVSASSHYSNPIHPLLTTSANSHFSTLTPPANNCFLPSIANTHADIDTRLFSLLQPSHCFLFIHGGGGGGPSKRIQGCREC